MDERNVDASKPREKYSFSDTKNHAHILKTVELLKAYAKKKDAYRGSKLHACIVKMGLLERSLYIGNTLISMYAKCGMLEKALEVLEEIPVQDVVSWNAMISGYIQHGQGDEALNCFERMQREGFSPDVFTFTCILKACGSIRAVDQGKQIHCDIVNRGLSCKNVAIGNALVDMYARCGMLATAQQVLEKLPVRNVICWSSLIAGYAQEGKGHEALNCFEKMKSEGIFPDEITFTCVIKACASIRAIGKGIEVHNDISNRDLLKKNIVIGTALVDMYAKCGVIAKAQRVHNELPFRNVISWSALIGGYTREGKFRDALNCFNRMQREGLFPNEFTFVCILEACGSTGAIQRGQQIHDEIIDRGFLPKNIVLGTALIDFYAKCDMLVKAHDVLEKLHVRDTVSWSALIAGYAEKGHCHQALKCFEQMRSDGISPNEITFLCILSACSHSGKSDEAQTYYEDMTGRYGITPKAKHDTCMVVVFGWAGRFDKVMSMIRASQSSEGISIWLALLTACRKWQNIEVGEFAFEKAIHLDDTLAAPYILMAGIYAAAGMQENAERIETQRTTKFSLK